MKSIHIYILFLLVALTDCKGQSKNTTAEAERVGETYTFQMITIPSTLSSPDDRAAYLVAHYWDNFNFTDTAFFRHDKIVEQSFVDYIDIFPYTRQEVAAESIRNMLEKSEAEEKVLNYFADLYEKYLYEANSPMRNDEYYIPVLETLLKSSVYKNKIRMKMLLEMASKNRIGMTAENFAYTLEDGSKAKMHDIKAAYTLVFFYNPDCRDCKRTSAQLTDSKAISSLQTKGEIKILAIYTDRDLEAWRRYLPQMHKEWIVAFDSEQAIDNEGLYDLKAIPSLYLLDNKKKVLLKDATFEQVEDYLNGI